MVQSGLSMQDFIARKQKWLNIFSIQTAISVESADDSWIVGR
jgi:hypothetical protein